MTFLDLPTEILVQIFTYLPPLDIASCSSCSRFLRDVVKDSIELQYNIQLHTAQLDNNPRSQLLFGEKLALVKGREKGWATLVPDFVKEVKMTFEPGSIYDLSADVYLLGDTSRTRLYYLPLPSSPEDNVDWKMLSGPQGKQIVDFAINLYEHDLIVMVTAPQRTPLVPQQSTSLIELHLRKFSTNTPHPLAKQPIIPLVSADRQWGYPALNMEIVGDYLTVVTSFWRVVRSRCTVTIYDWKSGRKVMKIDGRPESYSGIIYLTETLILLPNLSSRAMEVWKIPTSEEEEPPTKPLLCLHLPRLASGCFYDLISCRAEPNPIHSTLPGTRNTPSADTWYSTKPFHPRPDDSVILLHIRIIANGVMDAPSDLYTLFIHRGALVRLAEAEISDRKASKGPEMDLSSLSNITSTLQRSAAEAVERGEPGPSATAEELSAYLARHEQLWENPDPRFLNWQEWAAPHSFMISSGMGNESRWITTSCGGRFVLLVPYETRRRRAIPFPKIVGWENLHGIDELDQLEDLTSPKRKRQKAHVDDDDSAEFMDEDEEDEEDSQQGKEKLSRILVFDFNPHNVREAEDNPRKGRVVIQPKSPATPILSNDDDLAQDYGMSQAGPSSSTSVNHATQNEHGFDMEVEFEDQIDTDEEYDPLHLPEIRDSQPTHQQQPQQQPQSQNLHQAGLAVMGGAWATVAVHLGLNDEQDLQFFWNGDGDVPKRDTPFDEKVESQLPCVITVATTRPLLPEAGQGISSSLSAAGPSAGPSFTHSRADEAMFMDSESLPVLDIFNDADGLLADDERILGIKTGVFTRIESVSIAHFGA